MNHHSLEILGVRYWELGHRLYDPLNISPASVLFPPTQVDGPLESIARNRSHHKIASVHGVDCKLIYNSSPEASPHHRHECGREIGEHCNLREKPGGFESLAHFVLWWAGDSRIPNSNEVHVEEVVDIDVATCCQFGGGLGNRYEWFRPEPGGIDHAVSARVGDAARSHNQIDSRLSKRGKQLMRHPFPQLKVDGGYSGTDPAPQCRIRMICGARVHANDDRTYGTLEIFNRFFGSRSQCFEYFPRVVGELLSVSCRLRRPRQAIYKAEPQSFLEFRNMATHLGLREVERVGCGSEALVIDNGDKTQESVDSYVTERRPKSVEALLQSTSASLSVQANDAAHSTTPSMVADTRIGAVSV